MRENLPSISALQAFRSAARHESFTRAAEELNLTQGAISHQIKGLEDLLGVPLFLRIKRHLKLTQQGRDYLAEVTEALTILQDAGKKISVESASGTLTVSVSPNFAAKWLVHRLGDFIASHPEIELRVSASMQHVDFVRTDIDMAVRHGNGDWPDLAVTQLVPEVIFPVCSPEFLEHVGADVTPENLLRLPLLHDRSREDWPHWLAAAGLTDVTLPTGPQFDQTSMVLDAAVEGQGIALARSALAARDLIRGRLVRLFEVSLPAPFAYYIVSSKSAAKSAKVQLFRDWLLTEAERDRQASQN